ncbi:hypothetical protein D9Q98_001076 [Chlorella vulgaris]|uniref:Uncharacterized protein n=1 Tax=Chlorella vulgaris TaxID=3077 RepID=A0A9D4Z296_CHLVU|nr:hypothetical protein D9Q98_001076 [Chlorella vulgaris]
MLVVAITAALAAQGVASRLSSWIESYGAPLLVALFLVVAYCCTLDRGAAPASQPSHGQAHRGGGSGRAAAAPSTVERRPAQPQQEEQQVSSTLIPDNPSFSQATTRRSTIRSRGAPASAAPPAEIELQLQTSRRPT